MKIFFLVFGAVLFTSGCASTNDDLSHWQGESLSSLIQEYGPPTTFLKLGDGNKVVEFNRNQNKMVGNFCTLSFMVDGSNTILGGSGSGNAASCN